MFKQYAAKYIASKQASNKNFKNLSQAQLQSMIERQLGGEITKGLSKVIAIKDTKTSPDINNFDKIFTINIGGQTIGIDIYGMDAITKTMIPVMQQIDPNFRNNAKIAILEKCKQYGIDDTFCFQQGTRQRFETIDRNSQAPKQPTVETANKSHTTAKKQEGQEPKKEEITVEQIEDQRNTAINSNEIVYRLNPYLLKQMIELPNGAKIPASQYIQEAVAPHIPSNGKIILNNGAEIPATQFIEEYILGEGQQKYKGDIGKLMSENTRANNGTIISRGQKINVVSIVDSLNPTLMGKMVTLPNGANIPASQYVQEVVAPYIPSNGKFILKNGAELSAQQFIEEFIMFEGQQKYSGDIKAIIDAYTKPNNGTIMANKQMYKALETKQITTEKSDINQQKKQQFRTQTTTATQPISRQQVEQKKAMIDNLRPRQTNYHEKAQQFRTEQSRTLTPQQAQQKRDIFENRGPKQEQTKTINTVNIVDMLNPALMGKMIELPNGAKIPARQYVQEAVAPHIPSNGKFILKNGAEISAKQYLEEYILGEGQQKYKGDIGKLIAENTRANNGTIISRGQKINVVSIVDSLNTTLMGKMVTLPNGAKIPASQYVQEVVAPYIPSNGKFILKNGAEIPATQFIEEAVMFVGQEKYNGDINALLNAMTVANNGTVSVGTDTKPPKGHVKRQEMGGAPKKQEETTARKSNERIMVQSVKKSLSKARVTTSEASKATTRMGEREERKKLNTAKANGTITPEQQERLNDLNRRLFSNPQHMPYQQQGTRKNKGQGMSR